MPEQRVEFCPHCGNKTPQKIAFEQLSEIRDDEGYTECRTIDYFMVCGTCKRGLVYTLDYAHGDDKDCFRAQLIWPDPGILDNVVPEAIRKIYAEAVRIKGLSPGSFAVQIRRALEALCKDRGVAKQSLMQSLQELANKGEIPDLLTEMTDVLRLLGNYGAHFDEQSVLPRHIDVIDEFFRAIIEYVYVAPNRISEVRAHLQELKAPAKVNNKNDTI